MIDTLMAIWNRGYGGRGILVSLAFLLICISISLLLVTVGNSWSALWSHHGSPARADTTLSAAAMTATAQSQLKVATPGGTPLVYLPTITPTTNPCLLTPTTGKASHVLISPTSQHGTGGHSASPTPTPTPYPRPTATATPHPRPTNTPAPTATPTAIATATGTPPPTPSPTATATSTPSPTATATDTPTATPTVTSTAILTATPTVGISPTVPPRRRGGTPVPTPSTTAAPGQKTAGGKNCSTMYSGSGDSVGLTLDGSIGAILVRNLWIILGGSTLGTLLFYISLYLLNRKRMRY
ncbi:MAG TPA: hypothetical protein VKU38_04740 [Ktedonobacteraceae bacterium]|nr:hypothetical protein [Ktedonobacteraceae bacterium]